MLNFVFPSAPSAKTRELRSDVEAGDPGQSRGDAALPGPEQNGQRRGRQEQDERGGTYTTLHFENI